jgi:Dolichyl-phosphate-mannose-protein mannosyltransferase
MGIPWRKHIPFLVILAAFVALAAGYSVVNPLYESTDEIGHWRYVEYLRIFQRLPQPRTDGVLIQSHHPPLFHAAAALVSAWVPRDRPWDYEPERNPFWGYRYWEPGIDNKNQFVHRADEAWPYRGTTLAIHVVRWFNIVLGALTVWLAYRLALIIFPERRALALGATAFVAFNPMFLHLSGGINNDVAAGLVSTATLLVCMKIVGQATFPKAESFREGESTIQLGVLFGLALLTKFNLLALLPVIEIALAVAAYRARSWKAFARANLTVLGLAALIAGWWYLRNMLRYGEASGVEMMSRVWGGARVPSQSLGVALSEMPYLWTTLWGRFGYGQIPLTDTLYIVLGILVSISLPGLILVWIRSRHQGTLLSRRQSLQLALCGLSVFLFWGTVFAYATLSVNAAMGRFLFPALACFGVLAFLGLSGWIPSRWEGGLAAGVNLALAALAVYCLVGVLAPAYARPALLSEKQITSITHPTQAVFGDQVRLLGYDMNTNQLRPGDEFVLTAYWQVLAPSARDLTMFIHLLSREGPLVAQRDTYPGLGKFPASSWQPGDAFSDRYRIVLDSYTFSPDAADVTLGAYIPGSGRLPVTNAQGQEAGTAITLTQVTITPLDGAYPNSTHVNFGGKMTLVGYALSDRSVRAGQTLTLTLYWQIPQPAQYDYSVFAHVLGKDDQKWAANDGFPYTSPKRTRRWTAGQVYTDTRALRLAPDTPPGLYPIEFGLYGGPGDNRLPILAADGHQINEYLLLTQVKVGSP